MGISIDEAINMLIIIENSTESLKTAIEIIQKYQKIEQILSDWINNDLVGMSDYWMGRIKEVMEDGNDN